MSDVLKVRNGWALLGDRLRFVGVPLVEKQGPSRDVVCCYTGPGEFVLELIDERYYPCRCGAVLGAVVPMKHGRHVEVHLCGCELEKVRPLSDEFVRDFAREVANVYSR